MNRREFDDAIVEAIRVLGPDVESSAIKARLEHSGIGFNTGQMFVALSLLEDAGRVSSQLTKEQKPRMLYNLAQASYVSV